MHGKSKGRVAPFTGAWIEMFFWGEAGGENDIVAPFTGAWIEIFSGQQSARFPGASHPSRVRGLK